MDLLQFMNYDHEEDVVDGDFIVIDIICDMI